MFIEELVVMNVGWLTFTAAELTTPEIVHDREEASRRKECAMKVTCKGCHTKKKHMLHQSSIHPVYLILMCMSI